MLVYHLVYLSKPIQVSVLSPTRTGSLSTLSDDPEDRNGNLLLKQYYNDSIRNSHNLYYC